MLKSLQLPNPKCWFMYNSLECYSIGKVSHAGPWENLSYQFTWIGVRCHKSSQNYSPEIAMYSLVISYNKCVSSNGDQTRIKNKVAKIRHV